MQAYLPLSVDGAVMDRDYEIRSLSLNIWGEGRSSQKMWTKQEVQ